MDDLERVEVKSLDELWNWMSAHHQQKESIWLVTYKRSAGKAYVSTDQILDAVVAFGWMDGRRKKLDEHRSMQLLAPRKALHWSASYKHRAARLIDEGRMHPAGLRAIEASKRAGRWDLLDEADRLIVPPDLDAELKANPPAYPNYMSFPPSARRDILRWIELARSPKTRRRRIEEVVRKATLNERASGTS